ncbi:hypothetical protein [Rhodovulum sulfidophilum]|uniref:hypothetical protein n=1 Tax=Rhodovulum sulfidophilum TaxID=35806 RepID=UPI00192302F0|nr:hypothetical protein [Rhodovulum sulfidophilum]MBL3560626.1 hypothetical protein [Rhodovulum sulfidophilum]
MIALSLTNVSVAQFGGFRLMVFWPVLLLAIAINTTPRGGSRLPRSTVAFILATALMMMSWVINLSAVRITTAVYSLGWIVYWYWLTVVWGPRLAHDMERTLTRIAFIYFLAIAVSVLLSFLGWNESPLPNLLGWVLDVRSGQPRFFGPTSEPSYAALILGVTAVGILRIRLGLGLAARSRSSNLAFASIFVALMFLNSIYGFAVALLLLSAISAQAMKRSVAGILFVLGLVPLLPLVINLIADESRFGSVFALLSQFNFAELQSVDNSAYMRFGPTIEMFQHLSPGQLEFWIGHGAGTAEAFFGDLYRNVIGEDKTTINLGFFPAFVFDHGILVSVSILVYLFSIARGPASSYTRFLVFIALLNCNFNTNLFWFLITVVFATSPKVIGSHPRPARRPVYTKRLSKPVEASL